MESNSEIKTRGTLPGYKIFVFFIRYLGLQAAYSLLLFVVSYYVFFAIKERNEIFRFYKKMLGFSCFKSIVFTCKNFYIFGQTIIDKVVMQIIGNEKYSFEFDGEHYLQEITDAGKGGIVISAHVGNFEIAGQFLSRLGQTLNIVTAAHGIPEIKKYLETISKNKPTNYLFVKEDMSHVFLINKAFKNNELICFTGDRFFDSKKAISSKLFKEEALFPVGPYKLASHFKVPYSFVFAMKESNNHYHFYATKPKISDSAEDIVFEYAAELEKMIEKYPEQWFNYYDFWKK